jgi:hypothetical protein
MTQRERERDGTVECGIEITQRMIKAGLRELGESGRLIEGLNSGDCLLVRRVFAVMMRFREYG